MTGPHPSLEAAPAIADRPPEPGDPVGDGAPTHLWDRWSAAPRTDPRRARWLAEVRRGAGKPAGTVPQMWPHYLPHDDRDMRRDAVLNAEHVCLVLFGFHQQSGDEPMHVHSRTLPAALRELRQSSRFQGREGALDAKVFAAVTATSLAEMQWHLRSLVSLLKTEKLGFNYSQLCDDLEKWQLPGGPDRIRRRWGRDYFWRQTPTDPDGRKPAAHPSKGNPR